MRKKNSLHTTTSVTHEFNIFTANCKNIHSQQMFFDFQLWILDVLVLTTQFITLGTKLSTNSYDCSSLSFTQYSSSLESGFLISYNLNKRDLQMGVLK